MSVLCAAAISSTIDTKNVTVSIIGNQAFYQGYLSHEGITKLKNKIANADTKIEWLNITSGGGDVELGMDLGRFIFNNMLNIRVEDYCMSSCANYIFTAAKIKEVGERGLIGFHGGTLNVHIPEKMIQAHLETVPESQRNFVRKQMLQQLNASSESLIKQQTEFFNFINVDPRITNYGKQEQYLKYEGVHWGWYYSVSEYIKFNVKNVNLITSHWYYKSPKSDASLFEIKNVKL